MLTDIRNMYDIRWWLPIVTAACIVDTVGLFVWRYTADADGPVNTWYDEYGITAYIADITSMVIGIMLTQIVVTAMGGPWSPFLFCVVAVVIQMIHDIVFGNVIVPAIPTGHNTIIDLMKRYATMQGAGYVLLVDAIYMILTALIAMSITTKQAWPLLIVTLYVTTYILYTKHGHRIHL